MKITEQTKIYFDEYRKNGDLSKLMWKLVSYASKRAISFNVGLLGSAIEEELKTCPTITGKQREVIAQAWKNCYSEDMPREYTGFWEMIGGEKVLLYNQWLETHTRVENVTTPNAPYDGCMFETFGDDLDVVRAHDARQVWTIVDAEGDVVLIAGASVVNRIGYFITHERWTDEEAKQEWVISRDSEYEDEENALSHIVAPIAPKHKTDYLLRSARTVIAELIDKAWELGGYTVGDKEFNGYSFVKNGREMLDEIEQYFRRTDITNPLNVEKLQSVPRERDTMATVSIDIKKNGTTIFSTKLTIDAGEKTSVTAVLSVCDNCEETYEEALIMPDGNCPFCGKPHTNIDNTNQPLL